SSDARGRRDRRMPARTSDGACSPRHRPFAFAALLFEFGDLVLPLARAGGGLRCYSHQPGRLLAEHAKDDRPVGVHDDLERAGLETAVTGNLEGAEPVVALEGIAASLSQSARLSL